MPTSLEEFERGNSYFSQGQYSLAIEQYSLAIEIKKEYWAAYLNRGNGQNLT